MTINGSLRHIILFFSSHFHSVVLDMKDGSAENPIHEDRSRRLFQELLLGIEYREW